MNDSKNPDTSTNSHEKHPAKESPGQVLPFRRPLKSQPTLPRRPSGSTRLNKSLSLGRPTGTQNREAPQRTKGSRRTDNRSPGALIGGTAVARIFQITLLFVAILLALKNCGKL